MSALCLILRDRVKGLRRHHADVLRSTHPVQRAPHVVGMLLRQMPSPQGTVGLFRHRKSDVEHPAAEPTAIASTAYDTHASTLTVIRQHITPPDG
jgi:hypothetical protein